MNGALSEQAAGTGERHRQGSLRRLLRPTLEKKFLLTFALLLFLLAANLLVVMDAAEKSRGMGELINVTGSLRWLGLNVYGDTVRFLHGDLDDRQPIDASLARLDAAVRLLETGADGQGRTIRKLPGHLDPDTRRIGQIVAGLHWQVEACLSASGAGREHRAALELLHRDAAQLLASADAIASVLAGQTGQEQRQFLARLIKLGFANLAFLLVVMAAIRLRIVAPLRKLIDATQAFAAGQRGVRSGFHTHDELGWLATVFDDMAERIEDDIRMLNENAAELDRRNQSLRKFSLAVEHSPISVVITDASRRIEYVNRRFLETYGYTAEEVIGRSAAKLVASGQTPAHESGDSWRAVCPGREWTGEFLSRRKSGELFWGDVHIVPLKDEQGRVIRSVFLCKDITKRKAHEATLARSKEELERLVEERTRKLTEMNRELESFSYSISHDLRTPLRAINGFTHLIEESCGGSLSAEASGYFERVRNASLRMGRLIDDLLDLARLTRQKVEHSPIDLSGMAHAILDDLAGADPSRKVERQVRPGMTVQGDPGLVRSLMDNLIGNAWKYSSRRALSAISIGRCEEDGEPVFFVRDNGAGFDMRYVDKLFGAFQRLHKPQDFEGSGIGLATARRIVTLHGGRIWAEAAPEAGATFFFTLPAPPSGA